MSGVFRRVIGLFRKLDDISGAKIKEFGEESKKSGDFFDFSFQKLEECGIMPTFAASFSTFENKSG
jgi:hypothetical protein